MNARRCAAALLAPLLISVALPADADPLSVFQPSTVRAVSVTAADARAFHAFPVLDAFGTVTGTRTVGVEAVASRDEAVARAGHPLRLPARVAPELGGTVRYEVSRQMKTWFTFHAASAAAWARERNVALAPFPPGLDGTTYTVDVKPVVIVIYGDPTHGTNAGGVRRRSFVAVMQAPVPTIATSGAPLSALSDWITRQPGIPPRLAAQVRAIGDPTQTLPIPVRFDRQTASDVDVDGVRGLAIGDQTGIGSAVVWTKNGILYAVGGTLTQSDALTLAGGLT
ncbi:MAG TPA: hypothetical protein VGN14_05825 [Candidatus Elarobacter sp.]|jgi:hypothetical protein